MNRKLAWGLVFGFLLIAVRVAHALAPSGIEVDSSLNEPLQARIALLNASPEAVSSLRVRQKMQPDTQALDLHFEISRKDGQAMVQVTTPKPVQEPALNFVLEFEWANGRLLREYSILLDPQ